MPEKSFVSCSAAKKKMYLYAGVWLLSVGGWVWVFRDNQSHPFVLFTIFVLLALTVVVLVRIAQIAKDAKCSNCGAQVFEVIETAKGCGVSFNYCPQCGAEIEHSENEPNYAIEPAR